VYCMCIASSNESFFDAVSFRHESGNAMHDILDAECQFVSTIPHLFRPKCLLAGKSKIKIISDETTQFLVLLSDTILLQYYYSIITVLLQFPVNKIAATHLRAVSRMFYKREKKEKISIIREIVACDTHASTALDMKLDFIASRRNKFHMSRAHVSYHGRSRNNIFFININIFSFCHLFVMNVLLIFFVSILRLYRFQSFINDWFVTHDWNILDFKMYFYILIIILYLVTYTLIIKINKK